MDDDKAREVIDLIISSQGEDGLDGCDGVSIAAYIESGHLRKAQWKYAGDDFAPLTLRAGGITGKVFDLIEFDHSQSENYDAVVIAKDLRSNLTVFQTFSGDAAQLWSLPVDRYDEAARAANPRRIRWQ